MGGARAGGGVGETWVGLGLGKGLGMQHKNELLNDMPLYIRNIEMVPCLI